MVGDAHDDAHVVLDQQHADALFLADLEQQLGAVANSRGLRPAAGSSRQSSTGSVHMARAISSRRWAP